MGQVEGMRFNTLWNKRKSVFASWMFSYMIILFIPVFFIGLGYFITYKTMEDEINRSNYGMLNQIRLMMDNSLKDAENICLGISLDPDIQLLLSANESSILSLRYTTLQMVERLKRERLKNGYINNFYIYFDSPDAVLSTNALSESQLMFSVLGMDKYFRYEEWIALLREKHTKHYYSVNARETNQLMLNYSQSLFTTEALQPMGTVVVQLNQQRFSDMINSVKGLNEGTTMIIDGENRVLMSNGSYTLPEFIRYEELSDTRHIISGSWKEEEWTVVYTPSEVGELKYLTITPQSIFMKKSKTMQIIMVFCVLLCIGTWLVLSIIFARRNYDPLRQLMKELSGGSSEGSGQDNEYQAIKIAIQGIIGEKQRIHQVLGQQNAALKANLVTRLLKGRGGSSDLVNDMLTALEIRFASESFVVVLFYIEDFGDLFPGAKDGTNLEELMLVQLIITNVMEEIIARNHIGIMVEVDGLMACLVNLKKQNSQEAMEDILQGTQEVRQFIRKNFNIQLTVAVSNVQHAMSGIPRAYAQACEAMEYKLIKGNDRLLTYREIAATDQKYYYPLEVEQDLIKNIKSGDYETAELVVEEIFYKNFTKASPSISMARCLMFDLVSTIIKTMDEISSDYENVLFEEMNPVEKLLKCNSLAEMRKLMKKTIQQVCQYILEQKGMNERSIGLMVKKLIDADYFNMNLNISMIAERLLLDPNSLSREFREQMGEGILDYINRVRLDKAKYLLKYEKMNVGEIARKVGYCNSNTFIRAFKRYEGITPGQYRESTSG